MSRGLIAMMIVRIRVYNEKGSPVGDLEVPVANAQMWLDQQDDQASDALVDIREIVDPGCQQEGYDWPVRAKPREVKEDIGDEDAAGLMQIE